MQSATGDHGGKVQFGIPAIERDPASPSRPERPPADVSRLSMLLLEDDPKEEERIRSSIRKAPAVVRCVPTVPAALDLLGESRFDAIMIDRHLGGWVSAQTCKALVMRAGHIPVVGLINENCVLGLQDGIEAGLTGVYYKDQMDVHLMRRLGRFAKLSKRAPLPGG